MKQKKRIIIDRFDNLEKDGSLAMEKFYNYRPGKTLENSLGVCLASFPRTKTNLEEYNINMTSSNITSIKGVAYLQQYYDNNSETCYRLLLYGDDNKVYINQLLENDPDLYWLYSLQFSSAPITLAFKQDDTDSIIIADKEKMVIWKAMYSPYTIQDVPVITSMCMNEGVLFCTIADPSFKLWFATDLNAENVGNISKNSGYITLQDELGNARKIITYNQDVYVFRDYGISKISKIKDEIKVSQVYKSNTLILSNTVTMCGNVVWFLTKDGIFTFNGNKVTKSSVDLGSLFVGNNQNAVGACLGEKYYVALKLEFDDDKQILCEETNGFVNNALVVINSSDNSYEIIRGIDINALLPVKNDVFEKMLCVFNSDNNNLLGEITTQSKSFSSNLPKYWCSGGFNKDFSVKLFTRLIVDADSNVVFKLIDGNRSYRFTTYQSGLNEFSFRINSKNLKIEISSNSLSANVYKVYLDYYEY